MLITFKTIIIHILAFSFFIKRFFEMFNKDVSCKQKKHKVIKLIMASQKLLKYFNL